MNQVSSQGGRAGGTRWSIAARTTWWFALTTAGLVAVICIISALFASRLVTGDAHEGLFARFGWLALILTVTSSAIAFAIGAVFIRRACGSLRQVTERVRAVHGAMTAGALEIPGAPDEIREIVEAIAQALHHARSETERTHLLTTGLAHQLGSPIQNLIGETEVALMSHRSNVEYRAVLHSHLEELRDIGRTVGNLMTLCTLSTDGPVAVEEFDLGRECDVRLRREQAHAERRGVALAIAQDGDLSVLGDREALLLAVGNVVANAIDWSPTGAKVELALRGANGAVEVTVDDAGPGIAADERAKIFEPFYRGPCANGKRAGYGLGLSITKQAIDTHGGTLEVASSPLGGARFTLRIPRERRRDHRAA